MFTSLKIKREPKLSSLLQTFLFFSVTSKNLHYDVLQYVEAECDAAYKAAAKHNNSKAEDQQDNQDFHSVPPKYNFWVFAIIEGEDIANYSLYRMSRLFAKLINTGSFS